MKTCELFTIHTLFPVIEICMRSIWASLVVAKPQERKAKTQYADP